MWVIAISHRKPRALAVDDDHGVRQALALGLELEGFDTTVVSDAEQALASYDVQLPDVLILDVTLPKMSGVEMVRRLRSMGSTVPVCMLSARDEVDDRVAGLAAGADDYVVKPFSIGELAARLHALVRLHEASGHSPLLLGDLVIRPAQRTAARAGQALNLTTREFDLLLAFARHPGQVLSRTQLLAQVWGYTWRVDTNVVDVFIGYLRKKLEEDNRTRIVHTVRGVGFVLRTETTS
ncbi:response regulator transcription factor [Streptomyces hygroscopicus]|uniref:response regulator transcription factor n=1 Tax=Streptomyces hygroscopicus TaxID=1912 RepID=UPI0036B38623